MNMQRRSEIRSRALHQEIAKKLRLDADLWDVPIKNLENWIKMKPALHPALMEWKDILSHNTMEEILSILESNSEEAIRLRSSSPFSGILSEVERKLIFDSFKLTKIDQKKETS